MIIAIACGVIVLLLGFGCAASIMNNMKDAVSKATETTVVTRESLSSTVQATGSLKPSAYTAVTPEISGVIQEVLVTEGQHVEAGDVLLTLKNAELDKLGVEESTDTSAGDSANAYMPFATCAQRINGTTGFEQVYGIAYEEADVQRAAATSRASSCWNPSSSPWQAVCSELSWAFWERSVWPPSPAARSAWRA